MTKNSAVHSAIVLVPGHWLGAWAWDAVAADLRVRGHRVAAVTLPGLDPHDPQRTARTLADQAESIRSAVSEAKADGSAVVLVVHSGAGAPASMLLDRDPSVVDRIIYVDSGPSADGSSFDATVSPAVHEVDLPPFEHLAASLDGLNDEVLSLFRQRAVPQPANVIREPVRLTNDARRDVPATIVACSYPADVVLQLAHAGNAMLAETATLRQLELVDLPTGHWPMWSRPADLAAIISAAAQG
jgi:pimeloyl-ACP methyl ester carboxylesterase